jgi:TonB family protein
MKKRVTFHTSRRVLRGRPMVIHSEPTHDRFNSLSNSNPSQEEGAHQQPTSTSHHTMIDLRHWCSIPTPKRRKSHITVGIILSFLLHSTILLSARYRPSHNKNPRSSFKVRVVSRPPKPQAPPREEKKEPEFKEKPRPIPPPRKAKPKARKAPPRLQRPVLGIDKTTLTEARSSVSMHSGNTFMAEQEKGPTEPFDAHQPLADDGLLDLDKPIEIKKAKKQRAVYTCTQVDQQPEFTTRISPSYPEDARYNEIEGIVRVSLIVNKKGNPRSVKLVEPLHESIDKEVVQAIKRSSSTPAKKNGHTVSCRIIIPYRFKLE